MKLTREAGIPISVSWEWENLDIGQAVWNGDSLFIKTDKGWVTQDFQVYGSTRCWEGEIVTLTELKFE